jgi:hypothetical protein
MNICPSLYELPDTMYDETLFLKSLHDEEGIDFKSYE